MKYFLVSKTMAYPIKFILQWCQPWVPSAPSHGRWLKCDPAGGGGTAGGGDGWFNLKEWMNWVDELGGYTLGVSAFPSFLGGHPKNWWVRHPIFNLWNKGHSNVSTSSKLISQVSVVQIRLTLRVFRRFSSFFLGQNDQDLWIADQGFEVSTGTKQLYMNINFQEIMLDLSVKVCWASCSRPLRFRNTHNSTWPLVPRNWPHDTYLLATMISEVTKFSTYLI